MQSFERFQWSSASKSEQLAMAQKGNQIQVCALARKYDWSLEPEAVLGWIMAQSDIDLTTALAVFLNGEPERFNYLPKRDVPIAYRGAARLLDNISQRLNCGFYLPQPGQALRRRPRLERWLAYQAADQAEGRQGRWVLDPAILEPVLGDKFFPARQDQAEAPGASDPWRRLVTAVA